MACDALRADAARWKVAADALLGAQMAAEGITFADKLGAIPQVVGGAEVIIASYERMRQKFTSALSGGAAAMADVSTTLMRVADTFEREDREAALRMKQERADR